MLDNILTEAKSPVARMRLFSSGIQRNNRLEKGTMLFGDAGCLACGNCIDNCPVVKENQRFVLLQNQRTSMNLETLVGEQCRSCYRCIKACPQVSKDIKEYASTFRRGATVMHFITAAIIVLLAATGITFSHWGVYLPAFELGFLRWTHRLLGIVFVFLPLLYWYADKRYMLDMLKKVTTWGQKDVQWVKDVARHIAHPDQHELPLKVRFNTAQKAWGFYLLFLVYPILTITGLGQIITRGFQPYVASEISNPLYWNIVFHMFFALLTDLGLFLHIYFKYVRNFIIYATDLYKSYSKNKKFDVASLYREEPGKS